MSFLPILTADELITALAKAGFIRTRQAGSHVILRHADGRSTVVPMHKDEDIDRRLLAKILRQVGMTQQDLAKLL